MKKAIMLGVLCVFAIFIAGCTSGDRSETPTHEMTVPPTPGGEIPRENTQGPSGDLNQTISGERAPSTGVMNFTQGGHDQPLGSAAGAPDGQFRNIGEMNGTFPAPGEVPGGMKPPAPPES